MYDNQITLDYSNSNDDYMEYDYSNNVYDNYKIQDIYITITIKNITNM